MVIRLGKPMIMNASKQISIAKNNYSSTILRLKKIRLIYLFLSGILIFPCQLAKSEEIVPTYIEFVDIAGLVKGASCGEGLGNQFLGQIREVDAICHVVRCFEDEDITHVEGHVDAILDAEII